MLVSAFTIDVFNPHTAQKHLEALTTIPHPFNSRANTDVTKKYLRDQYHALQEEAIALGRRNIRFDDGSLDSSTLVSLSTPDSENEEEDEGSLEQEEMQVVQGDNMVMWIGGVVQSKEGQVPSRVEIDVNQGNQTALLVSAHFGMCYLIVSDSLVLLMKDAVCLLIAQLFSSIYFINDRLSADKLWSHRRWWWRISSLGLDAAPYLPSRGAHSHL